MTREELLENYGDELLFLDPPEYFDRCILGVAHRCGMEPVVLYDQEEVINSLVLSGIMDREEAEEWFWFNVAEAYLGPRTPMFMEQIDAS